MRNAMLLMGMLAGAACSVDHVVVATLDKPSSVSSTEGGAADAGAGSGDRTHTGGVGSGATGGSAGSSGASQITGGVATSGGSVSGTIDSFVTTSGGTAPVIRIGDLAGAGGGASELVCSCLDDASFVCGTDGVSYTSCRGDGCVVPTIACWHACPCLDGEPDPMAVTSWFAADCPSRCSRGVICMTFTSDTSAVSTSCATPGK